MGILEREMKRLAQRISQFEGVIKRLDVADFRVGLGHMVVTPLLN